jgi:gliding motility-associated-like protein
VYYKTLLKSKFSFFQSLLLIFLVLGFSAKSLKAQLVLNTTQTPQQLVNNVLLGGGVVAFNITYNGSPAAIGFFNGVNSNIGLDSGIVMTTGTVLDQGTNFGPSGPNNQLQSFDNGFPGDAQLTAVAGNQTFNAAILEFDFIPVSDTVQFRYVFASEEYPQFVGQNYNDVFAFFLSGVSTTFPATNIALLPTAPPQPVTIATVNNGQTNNGPCVNCQFYINNTATGQNPQNGQSVRYRGFTTVLTARANVICGETYHIKMAVADVLDGVYDSGVFLEAGSFDGGSFLVNSEIAGLVGNDSVLYRNCSEGIVTINRLSDTSLVDTIYITKGGSAVEGVDYAPINDTVIFLPGDTSFVININPLVGAGGTENLTIGFASTTVCGGLTFQTLNVSIQDSPNNLSVTLPADTSLCPQEVLNINAVGSGGAYNQLYYLWNDSSSVTSQTLVFNNDTTIYVTITDFCQTFFDSDTINIIASTGITATISIGDTTVCAGNAISATAGGGSSFVWTPSTGINNTTAQTVNLTPTQTTTYTVTATSGTCTDQTSVEITVIPYPVITFDFNFPPVCFRDSIFVLNNASPTGGTYTGNGVSNNTFNPSQVNPGNQIITYTVNNQGCERSSQTVIIVNPIPNVNMPSLPLFCNNDDPITLNQGTPAGGSYSGNGVDGDQFFPDSAGIGNHNIVYSVTENNCSNSDSTLVNVEGTIADFEFNPPTGIAPLTVNMVNNSSGNAENVWVYSDGINNDSVVSPTRIFELPGEYQVMLITFSDNGCIDTITKTIIVEELNLLIPNVFSPNTDGKNDAFKPKLVGYTMKKAQIYNRWGSSIHEWGEENEGWNGKIGSDDASEGTYYFEFVIEDFNGEQIVEKGYFSLFR